MMAPVSVEVMSNNSFADFQCNLVFRRFQIPGPFLPPPLASPSRTFHSLAIRSKYGLRIPQWLGKIKEILNEAFNACFPL